MPDGFEGDVYFDKNGSLTEHRLLGEQELLVRYEDLPEKDVITVDGFRRTTALRTVIDIAAEVNHAQLDRIVQDCLDRRLFTVEEATARLAEPDMLNRHGADLLRPLLFG